MNEQYLIEKIKNKAIDLNHDEIQTWINNLRKELYTHPTSQLIALFEIIDENLIFTYGTLKQSHQNHKLLQDSKCIGHGILKNKTMLNIGNYPAIIEGNDIIKGEIYEIDPSLKPALDEYERVGYLYRERKAIASIQNKAYYVSYYEWIDYGISYPILKDGLWYNQNPQDYVWYATYGSNLLEERFMKYIDRTSSQQIWLDTAILELPYSIYYANHSHKWHGGVAFLDISQPGKAISKAYLILKSQLKAIHEMEGNYPGWYDDLHYIGELQGHEVYTITSSVKLQANPASNEYLAIIASGMLEIVDENKVSHYLHHDIKQLNLNKKHIELILKDK